MTDPMHEEAQQLVSDMWDKGGRIALVGHDTMATDIVAFTRKQIAKELRRIANSSAPDRESIHDRADAIERGLDA